MTMRLLLAPLLLAAAPQAVTPPLLPLIDGLPIGAIPKQQLPARGCAAYLWTTSGTRVLIAMAQADPAWLRLSVGGTLVDLERTAQGASAGYGFANTGEYGGGSINATLTLKIETQESLSQGAIVPEGTLRLDRAGQDSIVVPVSGLIGCV